MQTLETNLQTDYLVIGSGAVGMAFADVILSETNANIIIVDKLHRPGGHWNFAYPFVRLHQPSEYYGVSSLPLSKGRKDSVGLNKGLCNLASGAEVCSYFDDVMQHVFLPSGRVTYLPLCEYRNDGKVVSIITDTTYEINVNKKTVDATHSDTKIPSTHKPGFDVAFGVNFMPINALPFISKKPAGYVVIGGGKTGIDACLWLLNNGVDPNSIQWIVPRDAWLLDRRNIQPPVEYYKYFLKDRAAQYEALMQAQSMGDLFTRLESSGSLHRIDKSVQPSMYRCATVSMPELEQLRRVRNIVRLGRVKKIDQHEIVLEQGTIPTSANHIHIDCSANGLSVRNIKPVFSGNTITIQTVRTCQPAFSAAFIGHVEAAYSDETRKNELCSVIPMPYNDTDWLRMLAVQVKNNYVWGQDADLMKWLLTNRLEGGFVQVLAGIIGVDEESKVLVQGIKNNVKPALANLQKLMSEEQTRATA